MPLRLKINTELITDDVSGLEDMEENFFYQKEIFSYIHEITGDFVLKGTNYHFIRGLMINDICSEILVKIEDDACGQWEEIYEGVVYITDVKWNLSECEAHISITDTGIIGLIDDNKSVPMNLFVPTLKNGGQWDPPAIETSIGFVNPQNTFATADPRRGMWLFDALKRLVELISDGQISVRSDYFDRSVGNSDDAQKSCILMSGEELRTASGSSDITLKYKDLIGDVNKLFNIAVGFEFDQALGEKFLRIEPKSYFFQDQGGGYRFEGVNDVEQTTEEDLFYAVIRFGSYEPSENFDYLENVAFLSHDDQEYHLGGQCNIDNTLDIRTQKLVYDTNVIQRVLPTAVGGLGDQNWDDEVFIIQLFEPTPPNPYLYYGFATPLPYNPSNIYFNTFFSPYQISQRWFGNIPFSIFSYLGGTGANNAEGYNPNAQPTQSTGTPPALGAQYEYIDFPQDISDPNNNLNYSPMANPDPTNLGNISHYQAPSGGLYAVDVSFCWNYGYWQYFQFLVINPAGGVEYFVQPYNIFEGYTPLDPYGIGTAGVQLEYEENVCISVSAIIPMQAGHRLVALVPYAMGRLSDAEIDVKATLSGEFQKYDFSATKYLKTEFDFPVHLEERNQILNSPYLKQELTYNGGRVSGYLSMMKRNLTSGETRIEWAGSF
jgi:hypothetical protein